MAGCECEIVALKAREILDSKARPMVEVDVWTAGGAMGRGASPCGTSVGALAALLCGGLLTGTSTRNLDPSIFKRHAGSRP